MNTEKIITIAGKEVGIKYCFATEIGFSDILGIGLDKYDTTNPRHISALIMSAVLAYYEAKRQKAPFDMQQILFDASPKELVEAITEVLKLRAEWYALSEDDTKGDKPADESSEKNA